MIRVSPQLTHPRPYFNMVVLIFATPFDHFNKKTLSGGALVTNFTNTFEATSRPPQMFLVGGGQVNIYLSAGA